MTDANNAAASEEVATRTSSMLPRVDATPSMIYALADDDHDDPSDGIVSEQRQVQARLAALQALTKLAGSRARSSVRSSSLHLSAPHARSSPVQLQSTAVVHERLERTPSPVQRPRNDDLSAYAEWAAYERHAHSRRLLAASAKASRPAARKMLALATKAHTRTDALVELIVPSPLRTMPAALECPGGIAGAGANVDPIFEYAEPLGDSWWECLALGFTHVVFGVHVLLGCESSARIAE